MGIFLRPTAAATELSLSSRVEPARGGTAFDDLQDEVCILNPTSLLMTSVGRSTRTDASTTTMKKPFARCFILEMCAWMSVLTSATFPCFFRI
jgi:hypothetical protein